MKGMTQKMFKKVIVMGFTILLVITLVSCSNVVNTSNDPFIVNTDQVSTNSTFVVIEKGIIHDYANDYIIVYHKNSKVMYFASFNLYKDTGILSFTPLLNSDGTPMLYEN